jgi:hypothetical protein
MALKQVGTIKEVVRDARNVITAVRERPEYALDKPATLREAREAMVARLQALTVRSDELDVNTVAEMAQVAAAICVCDGSAPGAVRTDDDGNVRSVVVDSTVRATWSGTTVDVSFDEA